MSYTNYSKAILIAAKNLELQGTVKNANFIGQISNISCQDSVIITAYVNRGDVITEILYEGSGCVLSRGSCALLLSYFYKKKMWDLARLPLETFFEIVPVEDRDVRQECFLLGWKAFMEGAKKFGV